MIIDGLLTFSGTSNGATGGITAGPQTDSPTTGTQIASNILDLGVTSGVPSSASGGGARDLGTGDNPALKFTAICPVAFTGGTSLQLELDGAPDNGSGSPGTYTIMWQSQAIAEASLTAGAQLANIDLPRPVPGQVLPRFLRLRYISVGTHSTGTIEAGIVIDRVDQILGATGLMSNYPAGITIAN
jgi:hypothetical protein